MAVADSPPATSSPVERAYDVATSSAICAAVLIVGALAATMACLPVLLVLRVSSVLFYPFVDSHGQDDVDSSIRPYAPPSSSDVECSSLTERMLLNFVGSSSSSLSGTSGGRIEERCISRLWS